MKACPWCGRNNLDSDEYCFNCERDLDTVPDEEEALELEQEIRRTRVYRPPSILRLVLMSLLRKIVLVVLVLGAFFVLALAAIWLSYDNMVVFLVVSGFMGAAVLAALYYPDAMLSRRVGLRGVWVTLISNTILLVVFAPPVLWFMSRRGYIGGALGFLGNRWWVFLAFLALGVLISWLAGRRAYAEAASP